MSTFQSFLKLGIEHIWTGYDHLLFLFGLLLVCERLKSVVILVSCFTLAHSLTLFLTTVGAVQLSGRVIEPLIAATIMGVGIENLVRPRDSKWRGALAFIFGLIHGFGFASVLRDLGVGTGGHGLILPLFSFNLGVEIGQLFVVALVLPLLWWLRHSPRFVRYGIPSLSLFVTLVGLYWLIERLWWGG